MFKVAVPPYAYFKIIVSFNHGLHVFQSRAYKAVWQHSILILVLSPSACHSCCRQFGKYVMAAHITSIASLGGNALTSTHGCC